MSKCYQSFISCTVYFREYELRLPRSEVQEVDQLRENWHKLLEMADEVRHRLLKQQRGAFEQELDKQVKVSQFIFCCLCVLSVV